MRWLRLLWCGWFAVSGVCLLQSDSPKAAITRRWGLVLHCACSLLLARRLSTVAGAEQAAIRCTRSDAALGCALLSWDQRRWHPAQIIPLQHSCHCGVVCPRSSPSAATSLRSMRSSGLRAAVLEAALDSVLVNSTHRNSRAARVESTATRIAAGAKSAASARIEIRQRIRQQLRAGRQLHAGELPLSFG